MHSKWLRIDDHQDAVIFHRIGIVVAEVTSVSNKRADARIEHARSAVAELRRLATALRDAIDSAEGVESLRGPQAARELRAFRPVAQGAAALADVLPSFMREHGALFEDALKDTLAEFQSWVKARVTALEQRVADFNAQVAEDLSEARPELEELSSAWAATEADGVE